MHKNRFHLVTISSLFSYYVQLEGTDSSIFLGLLRMFAHGTWSEYKSKSRFHFFLSISLQVIISIHLVIFCYNE